MSAQPQLKYRPGRNGPEPVTTVVANRPIDRVLARFSNLRSVGPGQWAGFCPAHDDRRASLSVGVGDDDCVLVHCHAGCAVDDVLSAAGLTMADLHTTAPVPRNEKTPGQVAANYRYTDEQGNILYEVVRLEPKDFRQRQPDGKGGWKWSIKGVRRVLYRLPQLLAASTDQLVLVVEGEKDADRLISAGLTATTNSGGANKWHLTEREVLAGRHVVILPDNDKTGADHANAIAADLWGRAASVRILELPGLPEHGDVSDWLDLGHTAEELLTLAEAQPLWSPDPADVPAPLDVPSARPLPRDLLPGWLGEMVEAVARATETPRELATAAGLGAIAAAVQDKMVIQVGPGYREPLCLWMCPALDSGNRKTAAQGPMIAPLIKWERQQAAKMQPEIERVQSERQTLEARVKRMRAEAAKADGANLDDLKARIAELESQFPDIPRPPRLVADDITPEHLAALMGEHDESIAIISDEGGIFDLMGGRYSNGQLNLDIYLKGHSGSAVRVDRVSRPSVRLDHPRLTLCLSPQPQVLSGLTARPEFRGRGLLARFMFMLPQSLVGYRSGDGPPVPWPVAREYQQHLHSLLDIPKQRRPGSEAVTPYRLRLTPEALSSWRQFSQEVEHEMRPGGRYQHLKDWASKLAGGVARIAGLLHCVTLPPGCQLRGLARRQHLLITQDTMERAITLGHILGDHALAAFDLIGENDARRAARKAWEWIERNGEATFTFRDCWHSLRGTYKTTDELEPGIRYLLDTGHIAEVEQEKRPGRPSRVFQVHHAHVAQWKRQKT